MTVRVIPGEISAKDATTRTILPTTVQGSWPPFERVAETIASSSRRLPVHRHAGVEVLTYVIEGAGSYQYASEPGRAVDAGSVQLMTAPTSAAHAISPGKGQTIRWFAVVASLAKDSTAAPGVQFGHVPGAFAEPEGTIVHALVGPSASVRSSGGLECATLAFVAEGTVFRRIGHRSLGICYALSGNGKVDDQPIEGGEGALVEESSGIAIHGLPGFRLMVVQLPRPPA
jgi:redox-sensitive bicupin YhaK (pirin superfamily)